MRDIGECAKLPFEAIDVIGFGAAERLQGHSLVDATIMGFVNHPHAARAQFSTQAESFRAEKISDHFCSVGFQLFTDGRRERFDRWVIVPYMICAINLEEGSKWTGVYS